MITQPLQPAVVFDGTSAAVAHLADALAGAGVRCCQWKGHWKLAYDASAIGDVDVLVSPGDLAEALAASARAGFKLARADARQYPGTLSLYAPVAERRRLFHLHLHYRLYLGHWASARRLPIEQVVLASAQPGPVLPVPAPELELVLRVLVRVTTPAADSSAASPAEARAAVRELEYLWKRTTPAAVHDVLARHLPVIDPGAFDACLFALAAGLPRGGAAGGRLRSIALPRMHPPLHSMMLRAHAAVRRVLHLGRPSARHLLSGGRMIAFVGGDGAGKSTSVREAQRWLGSSLDTAAFHLGRPPRSLSTLAIGALRRAALAAGLDAAGPAGVLTSLRTVCTARDRYRIYQRARRRSEHGTIVLCDRYPLPGLGPEGPTVGRVMPWSSSRLARMLRDAESRYYDRILPPDVVILCTVDPEVAAARKRGEDRAYVRARNVAMQRPTRWNGDARLHVIDAGQPIDDMLTAVRRCIWTAL